VVVEFAIVVPILTLLVLGIFEYGNAYAARMAVESAVQIAARADANLAVNRYADRSALQAFSAGMSKAKNTTASFMIIYKPAQAAGAAGPPSSSCLTAARALAATNLSPSGLAGGTNNCNIYSRDQIANAGSTATGFASSTACDPGTAWDKFWCPVNRVKLLSGPDYLGIYVEATYTTITKVPGVNTLTFSDYTVYRLEPDPTS
jgi:hypothetical protein